MKIKTLTKSWNGLKWEKCGQKTQKSATLVLSSKAARVLWYLPDCMF